MSWVFEPAKELFEEVASGWDALNRCRGDHILLDSRFVWPLIRHFGDERVVLGICKDSRKRGSVLVSKKHPGIWETFQPSQGPLGLIVLGSLDGTGEALGDIMGSLPGYALQFAVLQQDPDHSCFSRMPNRPNLEFLDYIQTARLPLQGTFESYWKSRSINLRDNLSRRRRRLGEHGQVLELVSNRTPDSATRGRSGDVASYGNFGSASKLGCRSGRFG